MSDHRILTREKVISIIKKITESDDVTIRSLTLTPGCAAGENYAGEVLACHVKAEVNSEEVTFDWMVKLSLSDKQRRYFMRKIHMEEKEQMMYKQVIPKFKQMVQNTDVELNFAPSYYNEFNEDNSILVLQNMNVSNYRHPEDKKLGFDETHAKLVLDELAKFHALSFAYFNSFPGGIDHGLKEMELLVTDYFCANQDPFMKEVNDSYLEESHISIERNLEKCRDEDEKINFKEVYQKFRQDVEPFDMRNELYAPNPSDFNILCHGDVWFNNILFK